MQIKDNEFDKLKERHEAPHEGCMFYILSFVGLSIASAALAAVINGLFPSGYGDKVFSLIFFFGFAGLAAWESHRAKNGIADWS